MPEMPGVTMQTGSAREAASWPPALLRRFDVVTQAMPAPRRRRLAGAFELWLDIAAAAGRAPDDVSAAAWADASRRVDDRRLRLMREIVASVCDADEVVYARSTPGVVARSPRDRLIRFLGRRLPDWPEPWRRRAAEALHVDPDGGFDGPMVEALAPTTCETRVEALSRLFAFARAQALEPDVTPEILRAWLRHRQAQVKTGEISIGYVAIETNSIVLIVAQLAPERQWSWLRRASRALELRAKAAPSRNSGRVVSAAELHLAGLALFEEAERRLVAARSRKARLQAARLARVGLAILILAAAPVRIGTLVKVRIDRHLSEDFSRCIFEGVETKEGRPDARRLPPVVRRHLARWLVAFRPLVAATSARALFVSHRGGGPITRAALSADIGRATEDLLGSRVTGHPFRHSVATYIVTTAPQEAALAGYVLRHTQESTTDLYRTRARQVIAGRVMARSHDRLAERLGLAETGRRGACRGRRGSS